MNLPILVRGLSGFEFQILLTRAENLNLERTLKPKPFAVLFSVDIVVSVKRFALISLLTQRCPLKIRW